MSEEEKPQRIPLRDELLIRLWFYVKAEQGGHANTIETWKQGAGDLLDRYIDERIQRALDEQRGEWR